APAAQALDGPILSADLNWLLRPTGMRRQDQPTPPAPVSPSSSPPSGPISPPAPLNPQGQVTPWGVQAVGAPTYWAALGASGRGAGVRVAVLDTGLDVGHPDLPAPIIGRNYDPARSASNISDHSGHGTHVAGTILARDNGIGVVGVAPLASLLVYRVCYVISNQTACPQSAIISALGAATNDGAKVFNLSLGGAGGSADDPMCEAVMHATGDHRVVVVSAGNDALIGNPVNYPAACPFAVSVAALNVNLTRADFSTFNDFVDIAAPGVSVFSTYPRALWSPGYDDLQGTSMAAPHVAGVAALLMGHFGHHPRPNPTRFAMLNGALDLGPTGRDDFFGSGLVRSAESAGFRAQRSDVNIERTRFEVLDVNRDYLNLASGDFAQTTVNSPVTNNWGDVVAFATGSQLHRPLEQQPYRTDVSGVFIMEAGEPKDSPDHRIARNGPVLLMGGNDDRLADWTNDYGQPLATSANEVIILGLADGTDRLSQRDVLLGVFLRLAPSAEGGRDGFPHDANGPWWDNYAHRGLVRIRLDTRFYEPGLDGRRETVVMTGDSVPPSTPGDPEQRRLLLLDTGTARMNNRGHVIYVGEFGDPMTRPYTSDMISSPLYGRGLFYNKGQARQNTLLAVAQQTPPTPGDGAPLWIGDRSAQFNAPAFNDRGDIALNTRGQYPDGTSANAVWFGRRLSSSPVRYQWTRVAAANTPVPTEPGDELWGEHRVFAFSNDSSQAQLDASGRVLFDAWIRIGEQNSATYRATYTWTPEGGLRRLYRSGWLTELYPPAPGFPAIADARIALGDWPSLSWSGSWLQNSVAGTAAIAPLLILGERPQEMSSTASGVFVGEERLDRLVTWLPAGQVPLNQVPYGAAARWPGIPPQSWGLLGAPYTLNALGQVSYLGYFDTRPDNQYQIDLTAWFTTNARGQPVNITPPVALSTSGIFGLPPYAHEVSYFQNNLADIRGNGEDGRPRMVNNRGQVIGTVTMSDVETPPVPGTSVPGSHYVLRTTVDGDTPDGIRCSIISVSTDDTLRFEPEAEPPFGGANPAINAVLEPGEEVRVRFAFSSVGTFNFTNAVARIVPDSPGVKIWRLADPRPPAVQPGQVVMPVGDIRVIAPVFLPETFWLSLPADAVCGEPVRLRVRIECDQGSFEMPVDIPTGQRFLLARTTESRSGPMVFGGWTSSGDDDQNFVPRVTRFTLANFTPDLAAPGSTVLVEDVNVRFGNTAFDGICWSGVAGLSAGRLGNLRINLVHPDGTIVRLLDRPGFSGNEVGRSARTGLCNMTFDDSAQTVYNTFADVWSLTPLTGSWKPADALSTLIGRPVNGPWQLEIQDDSGMLTGRLRDVSLIIRTSTSVCGQVACGPADIANTDGQAASAGGGPDGAVDNGDFTAFFVSFFADPADPARLDADIATTDGDPGADGAVDNGDFSAFFIAFFGGGCGQ
ncbi:MAG: S8 family serine peptidase, partial [Phycisphaerales bacterium]